MSLIPAHHHPGVEMPRAARYAAVLVLVVLAAIALAATVDRSGGNPSAPVPHGVRVHPSQRPAAVCDVSQQGRFVFIGDRVEWPAGCARIRPACSPSGRADRVAIGLACRPRQWPVASV
jgi:hypothetical protein